jgi:8-oxo-dGTP diphosphatase
MTANRELGIGRAVTVGRAVVNGPVFLLLFGPGLAAWKFMPGSGPWILGAFAAGFVLAWLWWSFSVPRWRVWAYQHVSDISELKQAAVLAGLTWPDGHLFERTEIKSAAIRAREEALESRQRQQQAEDMRSAIREEVVSIEPFDGLEHAHREEALAWIDSGAELCRIQKPAIPPKHLVSYFVLVDHDHVLLVDHKNAQLWLPSGGHVEPGEHPRATVARELREELGLDLTDDPGAPLMLTSAETVGTTAGHTDVSLWYVIDADRGVALRFDEQEFHSVRWFHFNEAPIGRSDPHLARFLAKLTERRVARV